MFSDRKKCISLPSDQLQRHVCPKKTSPHPPASPISHAAQQVPLPWKCELGSTEINSRPDLPPVYAREGHQPSHKGKRSSAGTTPPPSCSSRQLLLFGLHTPMAGCTTAQPHHIWQLDKPLAWGFGTKMLLVIFCVMMVVKHWQKWISTGSKEAVMIQPSSRNSVFNCNCNYRLKQEYWCEVRPPARLTQGAVLVYSFPVLPLPRGCWVSSKYRELPSPKMLIISFVWHFGAFSWPRGATCKHAQSQILAPFHCSAENTLAKKPVKQQIYLGAASAPHHDKLPLLLASCLCSLFILLACLN